MIKRAEISARFFIFKNDYRRTRRIKISYRKSRNSGENRFGRDIQKWINDISELPKKLKEDINKIIKKQLDTPYRPEGWTVKQLIHHIADSHMSALIRFKWALTEDEPTIKAYDEKAFADLYDSNLAPVEISLDFISALHGKWVILLENMSNDDFEKTFVHPETGYRFTLKESLATLFLA